MELNRQRLATMATLMPAIILTMIFFFNLTLTAFSINPSTHNEIVIILLGLIILGLTIGMPALILASHVKFYWRIAIGISYIPLTIFSLLISGF